METLHVRVTGILLLVVGVVLSEEFKEKEEGNGTLNTTWDTVTGHSIPHTERSLPTADLSMPNTKEDWSPFPEGDILNNPWLRMIRFCVDFQPDFCFDEEKMQGLRNLWPYLYSYTGYDPDSPTFYGQVILKEAQAISMNETLRARLYCLIVFYPLLGNESLYCYYGTDEFFTEAYYELPVIKLIRGNISLFVFNLTLALFTLIFGIFGNILIIVTILTKKELKTPTNLLLAGLAVTDFINAMAIIFTYLDTLLFTITNEYLGPVGCAILDSMRVFFQLGALNHLITLSFERYFAICWPMKNHLKFTPKKVMLIMIVNWLIAGVQLIPHILLVVSFDMTYYPAYECFNKWHKNFINWILLTIYELSVYLILPVPILCFNYICVVRTLLTSIKRSRQMTGDSSGQTQAVKARLKLVQVMIALVVIYIITVTPGRIVDALYNLLILDLDYATRKGILGTNHMLKGINSWTNVVVYAVISRQFRAAFKEVLYRCCRKPSGRNPRPTNRNGTGGTPARRIENRV